MPAYMARTSAEGLLYRRDSKLESFLKRNTTGDVYQRISAYEPCVVISETINKVYMHIVLGDDSIYLTEHPPRTVREAVRFRDIVDIELINDLPDFLRGRPRECSLHIRVLHSTTKPAGKRGQKLFKRGGRQARPRPPALLSSRRIQGTTSSAEGIRSVLLSTHSTGFGRVLLSTHSIPSDAVGGQIFPSSLSRNPQEDEENSTGKSRPASCPNPEPQGPFLPWPLPLSAPQSPSPPPLLPCQASRQPIPTLPSAPKGTPRHSSPLTRLMQRASAEEEREGEEEEREAELHLYSVSPTSRIYLHLQSSWSSYIIRSTLLLDTPHVRRSVVDPASPRKLRTPLISWERTAHLFNQLSGELLQEGIGLESLYLLLQELRTAAQRNPSLRKLFWRSSDLCPFLVKTLAHAMTDQQAGVHTADRLLLCTLVAQTLSVMFRETDTEMAGLGMLSAKQGALMATLLLALVCDPELPLPDPPQSTSASPTGQTPPPHAELQALQAEYLDAACALLFEVVVFCQQASRTPTLGHSLTVSWVLKTLKSHPSFALFVEYQAQQVVLSVSGPESALSPPQAVLLFQRCRLLLACLQYSADLCQHIQTQLREEFRYYVRTSGLEEKLPPHYPISQPARHLLTQLLTLILHTA